MDPNRLKELQELANQKKEKESQLKKEVEEYNKKRIEQEKEFKSKFSILKHKVFEPFVNETAKTGINVKFFSDDISNKLEYKIEKFFRLLYYSKTGNAQFVGINTYYINFEGFPNKNTIQITQLLSLNNHTSVENIGEFQIDDLDKDRLEEYMLEFLRNVVKKSNA